MQTNGPLTDDDGKVNIAGGNLIQFLQPFANGSAGEIGFNAAGGTGRLNANTFANAGTIAVNSGTAQLSTSSGPVRLAEGLGSTSVAADAVLELDDAGLVGSGSFYSTGAKSRG